jgi:mitochondrial fission protein ELM1
MLPIFQFLPSNGGIMSDKIIWILLGDKLGDNAQAKHLGCALQENFACTLETKKIVYNQKHKLSNLKLQASLVSMIKGESDELDLTLAPDIVIFTGRRAVPIARWIQKQSLCQHNKSTKLVAIGKPRAPFYWFDLLVSTRQYQLPQWVPNLVLNDFTLNRRDENESIDLPPHPSFNTPDKVVVVLLGGERSGFKMRTVEIEQIITTLKSYQENQPSHSLRVVASKSTPEKALREIFDRMSGNIELFDWNQADKPSYRELLNKGDVFFVTEDSASMVTEALSTGRPVYLLELFQRKKIRKYSPAYWLQKCLVFTVYAFGLYDPNRTVRLFTGELLSKGRVALYGDALGNKYDEKYDSQCLSEEVLRAMDQELQHVVNRVKGLL